MQHSLTALRLHLFAGERRSIPAIHRLNSDRKRLAYVRNTAINHGLVVFSHADVVTDGIGDAPSKDLELKRFRASYR